MSTLHDCALPPGWSWTTLREVGTVTGGLTKNAQRADLPLKLPYLRVANVYADELRLEDLVSIGVRRQEIGRVLLKKGDLLVVEGNGSADQIGRVAVWNGAVSPCLHQNHIIKVRLHPGAESRFVLFWLLSSEGRRNITRVASSTSGLFTLSLSKVAQLRAPLAPPAEQVRIVAALDSYFSRLDEAVLLLERVQRNLARYRAAVLNAAVTGTLVPTEAELARKEGRDYEPASALLQRILVERRRKWEEAELAKMVAAGKPPKNDAWKAKYQEPAMPDTSGLPDLPEGWCWANLALLKEFSLYGPRFSSDDYAADGALVLRTSDISAGGRVSLLTAPRIRLDHETFKKYRVEIGDLLITRTGSLGTVAVFNDSVDAIAGAYLIQFRLVAALPTSWFCFYFLKSPVGQAGLKGGGAGVGRPNLNAPTIEGIAFGLPPIAEQRRIVAEIERLSSVADVLEHEITSDLERSSKLRQAILTWAFEGKLVDQDPTDEPASVLLDRIKAERAAQAAATPAKPKRGPRRRSAA